MVGCRMLERRDDVRFGRIALVRSVARSALVRSVFARGALVRSVLVRGRFGVVVQGLPVAAAVFVGFGCEDAAAPDVVSTSGSEPSRPAPTSAADELASSSDDAHGSAATRPVETASAEPSSVVASDGLATEMSHGSRVDAGQPGAPALDAATDAGASSLERLRAEYASWQRHTAEPIGISAQIFDLCRLPSAAESAFVESVHGEGLYLLDWLNPAAYAATGATRAVGDASIPSSSPVFPVGAAIVKEKLARTDVGGYELAALGLMVKRGPGFDSAAGDWEFGYWEPDLGLSSGAAVNAACGPCHAAARTDFVYLDGSWH